MTDRPQLSLRARRRAVAAFRATDDGKRVEAAKLLAGDPGAFDELRDLLRREEDEPIRLAIAYALSWHDELRAWPVFLRLLSSSSEFPTVRGQAAEVLAYLFRRKRRGSRSYEAAVQALLAAVKDESAEVRYFSIFALGASGDEPALPPLRWLLRDRARGAGFLGTVAKEARDAIVSIRAAAEPRLERG